MKELVKDNIKELTLGETQEVIVLIKSANIYKSKIGTFYQRVIIRDRYENEAVCMIFDNLIPDEMIPDEMRLKINIGSFSDSVSYKILKYEKMDIPKEVFMPKARFNQQEAWNRLVQSARSLREPLNMIVAYVLQDEFSRMIKNGRNCDRL